MRICTTHVYVFNMVESSKKVTNFTFREDTKFAFCKSYNKAISCGENSTKVHNTTNFVNHLKSVHQDIHEEYQVKYQRKQEQEKANKPVIITSKQLAISSEEVQEKVRIWDINNARAQHVHRLVIEMIALDNQPFSVVFCW